MNAFYICGLEAKYAEEFSRNTRRLSQKGESSEVWPISKNREAPHLNKLGSLCRTLVQGWVQNRWTGLCEGSELPGTSSSLESGQAKNRGKSLMHGLFVARSQVQNRGYESHVLWILAHACHFSPFRYLSPFFCPCPLLQLARAFRGAKIACIWDLGLFKQNLVDMVESG